MRYGYFTCDVFSDRLFCGNQLAVLPAAEGLDDSQMQRIAREFNFAETTFVFPAEARGTHKVRIFTPSKEVPFAGHPNIGTAYVLAAAGALGDFEAVTSVIFEEAAGMVEVSIHRQGDDALWCELQAPQSLSLGNGVSSDRMASILSLEPEAIVTDAHPPMTASVGLPFLLAELKNRRALERVRIDLTELGKLKAEGICHDVHVYVRSKGEFDIRARMFAPFGGVPEDAATGSANCALAGLLSERHSESDGDFSWRIAQGVELGRPSVLDARAEKRHGSVTRTWIGGSSVLVSEGTINAG